ncbi:MAG: iron-containing alcohol dehydrogenase [Dehalococcoidales bacterium]|nr:iron-containing alcohol dehydrogenase [Dehalococcoidales bacterium]
MEAPKGEFKTPAIASIIFGSGTLGQVGQKVEDLGAKRALVVTVKSLAKTDLVEQVKKALGSRYAGVFSGVVQHVPRQCVAEGARMAKELGADLLVSLGGSSPSDAAKGINLLLTEGEKFEGFFAQSGRPGAVMPKFDKPKLPQIAIPTTLSAGEFSASAGITDTALRRKIGFTDVKLTAKVIILDPEATIYTGRELWASTGLKVLSDCFEEVCSPRHQPMVDALALHGARMISQYIVPSVSEPLDLNARAMMQHAAWLSMYGKESTGLGIVASLRHQIGATFNVAHGVASTIVFPHVLSFNRPQIDERLALLAGALGLPSGNAVLAADAAIDRVKKLIGQIGLPVRLRDVGVPEDGIMLIAKASILDHQVKTNPRPVRSAEELLGILEAAW